jgi:putative polyhydroxyalkanoate system protein
LTRNGRKALYSSARSNTNEEITMSDVQFQQAHNLGLPKARELAKQWAEGASSKMGLTCKHEEGADQDVITFERMGVNGTMTVTGTSFDLSVKLGMMMKAFKPMIEAEISKNLGRIIERASGGQA